MTDKIIFDKSELRLQKKSSVEKARPAVRELGWCIALFPFALLLIASLQIMLGFHLSSWANLIFCCVLLVLVSQDAQYMRVFFGAPLKKNLWAILSFLVLPLSSVYLFLRVKNMKKADKLKEVMRSQAFTGLIGWILYCIWIVVYLVGFVLSEMHNIASL
ncbi:MAG: hypothetical protein K5912_00140 [Alphaproteobacteria bacterium]|nr:hypothetical protein [Alphaproteobacteria bacterium]